MLTLLIVLMGSVAGAQQPETELQITTKAEAIDEVVERLEGADDDERPAIAARLAEERQSFRTLLFSVIDAGVSPHYAPTALDLLADEAGRIREEHAKIRADLEALLPQREGADKPDVLEREVLAARRREVAALRALHEVDTRLGSVGSATPHAAFVDEALSAAADVQAGEVLSVAESLSAHVASTSEVDVELQLLQTRLETAVAALDGTLELMELRGQKTSAFRQILIEATGEITADVLDLDVSRGLISNLWTDLGDWVSHAGPRAFFKFLMFVGILLVSWIVGRVSRSATRRVVTRTELTTLAKDFAINTTGRMVMGIGFLFALSQVGVDVTALVAGLGVAGIVIGFALQDTLSNFASGVMILGYRPFDVGDRIRVGTDHGVVQAMTLVTTTLLTPDNKRVSIPNNQIWQNTITNLTTEPIRRVDLTIGVSYDADLDEVQRVLRDTLASLSIVLDEPKPDVEVQTLGSSSVDLVVRPWCRSEDYYECSFAVTKAVKQRLDAEGIEIPFPQRVIHQRPTQTAER